MFKHILGLFLLFAFCSFAQIIGPRISIPVTTQDYGTLKQGEIAKFEFLVSNTGDDLLKITNVRASCGCTAVAPDKNELAPGEGTKIKVEFNSTGKVGKQIKHINVSTNDPKTPETDLMITINVIEPGTSVDSLPKLPKIAFGEYNHDFGTVNEGSKVGYTFNFENKGTGILEIKSVNTSCGCTAANITMNVLYPGEKGSIKVEFDTAHKAGKNTKTIAVNSNDPEEPNKILTITADVLKADNNK